MSQQVTSPVQLSAMTRTSDPPYCQEFIDFIDQATTSYHAVEYAAIHLKAAGYVELLEDEDWTASLKQGGKFFVTRNSSSIIAFAIGEKFTSGGPIAIIAAHVDAVNFRVKPISKSEKGGFERIAVAPYSGGGTSQSFDGSFSTWWDRDLGIGGRVLVNGRDGKVKQKLISISRPVARIPSLAVHFGAPAKGPFNYETNFVPIIGLTDDPFAEQKSAATGSPYGSIETRHSAVLLKAISRELGVSQSSIIDFDLELFDCQEATTLGLSKELISAPRLDDKLCAFAALWALIAASKGDSLDKSGIIQVAGLFDNEEIGSGLRQGAKSNFLRTVVERVVEAQVGVRASDRSPYTNNLIGQTLARSFLLSADVAHAFNPNFAGEYLEGASPELNKGVVLKVESNLHYTTSAPGATLVRMIAEKCGCELQLFHIRNDSRAGGTIGPMLSESLGCPTVDLGIPQLSMHSIRAITGNQEPGLGVKLFEGFYREYENTRPNVVID